MAFMCLSRKASCSDGWAFKCRAAHVAPPIDTAARLQLFSDAQCRYLKEVASCDPAPRAIALPAEFELSFRGPGSSSVVEELDKSGFSKKLYEK